MSKLSFVILVLFVVGVQFTFCSFFKETFDNRDKWTEADGTGEFALAVGKNFGDEKINQGFQTSEDAKFFAASAPFEIPVTDSTKDLIVQFSVKHEQDIDCGGGYVKILPINENFDPKNFNGETPYTIMFGPDICGSSTRRVHFIWAYNGVNFLWKKELRCETDTLTHVYTLIVHPSDGTYEVMIDMESKESGSLSEDWDFIPARDIPDPSSKKPSDWVDEKQIADPDDLKPEDWDNQPEIVPDPEADVPEDWDEEEDGEWEAPMIPNPDYRGEWIAKTISNPDYKGEWVAPSIPNPDYFEDDNVYETIFGKGFGYAGFEIWQVKSGSIFDSIIVTDDIEEAKKFAAETWEATKDEEKSMKEKDEEEERQRREEERNQREEEKKRREEEEDDDDDDEDEEDEEDEEELRHKERLREIKKKADARKEVQDEL